MRSAPRRCGSTANQANAERQQARGAKPGVRTWRTFRTPLIGNGGERPGRCEFAQKRQYQKRPKEPKKPGDDGLNKQPTSYQWLANATPGVFVLTPVFYLPSRELRRSKFAGRCNLNVCCKTVQCQFTGRCLEIFKPQVGRNERHARNNQESEMRKAIIVALGMVNVAVFIQPAFAKSVCQERRNTCYLKAERPAAKVTASKCDADYLRCIGADFSAQPVNPIVPAVPGLGMPMQAQNPTVPVEANPATLSSSSAQIATARTIRAHSKVSSQAATAASSTSAGTSSKGSSSSQGNSSSQGSLATQGSSLPQGGPSLQGSPSSPGVPSPSSGGNRPIGAGSSTGLRSN